MREAWYRSPDYPPDLDDPHETRGLQYGFQIPGWIWVVMMACYALFVAALLHATGASSFARFMIAIASGYGVMYFGAARLLAGLKGRERPSPLVDGKPGARVLETWCGPMTGKSVAVQVLLIPIGVAMFGIAVAVIWASVGV